MIEKRNTRKIFVSVSIIFMLFLCMNICNIETVRAKETETQKTEKEVLEEVKSRRNSVVRVESICWDGEAEIFCTKSFSGCVVSKDTSGIYVVTIHNDLTYTSEEKKAIKTEYKLDNNVRISDKIEVVFSGDLRIKASIVGESEQRNLSILKLDQAINFENVSQFSKEDVFDKEKIFLLSYPKTDSEEKMVYNTENVNIMPGTVLNLYQEDEIVFFRHDIQTEDASVGGPLLNSDGLVVGMLLTSGEGQDSTAISGKSLKEFLNTFNIPYEEYEEVKEEKKLPILNIVLGVVIIILFLMVIIQLFKNRAAQRKDVSNSKKKIHASLEYPAEKRSIQIHKKEFLIGRTKEADFVIQENKGISRKHACIEFDGKNFYLKDLKSTNHTFLNGRQVVPGEKQLLKNGDEIMVGKERLFFYRTEQ